MHLVRNHLRPDVCPHCEANTSSIPFEDVSANAKWLGTIGASKPWVEPHVFEMLPGGADPSFIKLDTFHLGPLGAGYYLAPSVLCVLVAYFKHFTPLDGKTDVESRLAVAHNSFMSYCKATSRTPRDLKQFTKSNLHWPSQASYPMLSCKAGDTIMLLQWLQDYLTSVPLDLSDDLLRYSLEAISAFNAFWHLLYKAESRIWWSQSEAATGLIALTGFLRSYQAAAKESLARRLGLCK